MAMDTTTASVLTGAIAMVGHWVQDKKIPPKVFVGVGVLALSLAALSEVNEKLASQFAVLILVGAVLIYAVPIGNAINRGTR